jgi:hypothetical protein
MRPLQWFASLLLLALVPVPSATAAADTNASPESLPARFNFEAFHLITERNIFNPHRSGRADRSPPASRDSEHRSRTESFSLLGTMSYEKGRFAFFDGNNSQYRRVLRADDNIGGFKIAAVAPTCVRLENTNGQTIELCVGMQMAKQEEQEWQVREATGSSHSLSETNSSAAAGDSDEVVKRLLQRREQEGGLETPPSLPPPAADTQSAASNTEPDEVVKRLLQKREQELTK